MHYDSRSFSKNGQPTIEAKQPSMTFVMGKAKELSATDLRKINKMYTCPQSAFMGFSTNANNNNNMHFAPPRPYRHIPYGEDNVVQHQNTFNGRIGLPNMAEGENLVHR